MIVGAVPSFLSGAVSSALPSNVQLYEGDVPGSPKFPYVLLQTSFPSPSERAVTRQVQGRRFTVRATIAGANTRSVEIIAWKLSDGLEGSLLEVDGWDLGALESVPNEQPVQPDRDVTIPGTATHPQYTVLDWVVIGSRKPA